jgi:hypothetical protein
MPVQSQLFTSDASARDRLNQALDDDSKHITPGSAGEYVARIQRALALLGETIDDHERDQKQYGPSTANAVLAFKAGCSPPLLNYANRLDNITGKKTTGELDRQIADFEKNNPAPPDPETPSGIGDVQIGLVDPQQSLLLKNYYLHCGMENIGYRHIAIHSIRSFGTFEELLDVLLTRSNKHQVIVNHGNPDDGMILSWCKESSYVIGTGKNIKYFSKIADAIEAGTANRNNPDYQDSVDSLKFMLSISDEKVILRIANKLVAIRKKQFWLHIRACNMRMDMADMYLDAFGADAITYHEINLLFAPIKPRKYAPGRSPADFPYSNNTERDRARIFNDPFGELTSLTVAVRHYYVRVQGASRVHVDAWSFVETLSNPQLQEWAETLIGKWTGAPGQFVLPLLWDNTERSWYCPFEWDQLLQTAFGRR